MMDTVAPGLRKTLALIILLVVVWAIGSVGARAVRARLAIYAETEQLRLIYADLTKRRIDLKSLEEQLASLLQVGARYPSVIVADSDRSATAQLQQSTLRKVKDAGGAALSVDGAPSLSTAGKPTVAIQLRARMSEKMVPTFLAALETEGSAELKDLTASVRTQANQPSEIEISAMLRAPWIHQEKRPP
jgi:hypothetical protein